MPKEQENSQSAETATFEETPGAVATEERVPVEITVAVGDQVAISGTVVHVDDDSVTIEINDGLENNVHRVTLNSNQAAAALK